VLQREKARWINRAAQTQLRRLIDRDLAVIGFERPPSTSALALALDWHVRRRVHDPS
jgi:hypothetical protein